MDKNFEPKSFLGDGVRSTGSLAGPAGRQQRVGALVSRPDFIRICHRVIHPARWRRIAVWAVQFGPACGREDAFLKLDSVFKVHKSANLEASQPLATSVGLRAAPSRYCSPPLPPVLHLDRPALRPIVSGQDGGSLENFHITKSRSQT